MNAETFFKQLDVIRSEARSMFGMKLQPIIFLSKPVQDLIVLVEAIHDEQFKKKVAVIQVEQAPQLVDHLAGLEPVVQSEAEPSGAMTLEKIPREPQPVHPVEVVEATKDTVVSPDGGWHDGDS